MTLRGCVAATASLFGAAWGAAPAADPVATVMPCRPPSPTTTSPSLGTIAGDAVSARPTTSTRWPGAPASDERRVLGDAARQLPTREAATARCGAARSASSWQTIDALAATVPGRHSRRRLRRRRHRSTRRPRPLPCGFTSLGARHEDAPAVAIDAPGRAAHRRRDQRLRDARGRRRVLVISRRLGATIAACRRDVARRVCTVRRPPGRPRRPASSSSPRRRRPADDRHDSSSTPQRADSAGQDRASRPFRLAPRPMLTGLSPPIGPASGGTDDRVLGDRLRRADVEAEGTQLLLDGPRPARRRSAPTADPAGDAAPRSGVRPP